MHYEQINLISNGTLQCAVYWNSITWGQYARRRLTPRPLKSYFQTFPADPRSWIMHIDQCLYHFLNSLCLFHVILLYWYKLFNNAKIASLGQDTTRTLWWAHLASKVAYIFSFWRHAQMLAFHNEMKPTWNQSKFSTNVKSLQISYTLYIFNIYSHTKYNQTRRCIQKLIKYKLSFTSMALKLHQIGC